MADNKNLDDLTNAAKLKLQAQKKQEPSPTEDIYAEFREEENYPSIEEAPINTVEEDFQENPINDEDFQIYENGPYFSQIEIWKKQYGQGHVLHTQIIDKHFIFRTLNRFEYKQIVAMQNVDALMREEIICSTCVLHPRNYDFKSMAANEAGYPSTLSKIIMENSGFTAEYGIEVL